jgi:hypothetical protein
MTTTKTFELTQEMIEDVATEITARGAVLTMLRVSPETLANYNRQSFGKERIILSNVKDVSTLQERHETFLQDNTVRLEASTEIPDDALEVVIRMPAADFWIGGE